MSLPVFPKTSRPNMRKLRMTPSAARCRLLPPASPKAAHRCAEPAHTLLVSSILLEPAPRCCDCPHTSMICARPETLSLPLAAACSSKGGAATCRVCEGGSVTG
eukprot:358032-Chlamydomonas_euryale.AAC.2